MNVKKNPNTNNLNQSITKQSLRICNSQQIFKRRQGNSFSRGLNKKKSSCMVSLFVNLPVFQEYTNIDLKKTASYQRINRRKLNNANQSCQSKQQQNSQPSNNQTGWKTKIEKYIEVRQKSSEKQQKDTDGYPLMRLSKKNELLRKIKTNQKFAGKPEIVNSLQTQDIFEQKPLAKKNYLPQIERKGKQTSKISRTKQITKTHLLGGGLQKKQFFKQVVQNANKSEKVLINFIGNYFRQKFCPERRYSHQIPERYEKEQTIKLKIKDIFQPVQHNSS